MFHYKIKSIICALIFGVDAGLGPWTGDAANKSDIMDEIFKQGSIELFMSGMRLEDFRRIHPGLVPPSAGSYSNERNRNFYPYPFDERTNNPIYATQSKYLNNFY